MGVRLGLEGKLYRNSASYATPTWEELTNVRDLTLNLEAGEADVTTRGNAGWRAIVAALKDASIEFEMVWDPADSGFTALQQAFFNKTAVEFAVMDGDVTTSGSQGLRASMSITSFGRSEPLEEAMTVSVTAKPTYADNPPEWMTVA
ncbi:phage tail tube protein [Maioricimonas sp. JC845]|uniref:phage tail tube protein n=1 Tax=Maioricimonas sp. JC845 TaxID=3232138 RepID=UPI00345AA7FF